MFLLLVLHFMLFSLISTYYVCNSDNYPNINKTGIWWYLTVFNCIAIPSCNHMETLRSNFEYWQNYPPYCQILGIANRTHFYSQYHQIPSATVGNHMGTHQIPLDTFGNPEYSNYRLFKRFLQWTRSRQKMETTDHFVGDHPYLCLFKEIRPKYKYIGIYCWQPKFCQVPRYLTVFGLPTSNTSCCQIPPNTIWELAFRKGLIVFNLFV